MTEDDQGPPANHLRQELFRERGALPVEQVLAAVDGVAVGFHGAPARTFVPVLRRRRLVLELSGGR